jgi:hypothetical protein
MRVHTFSRAGSYDGAYDGRAVVGEFLSVLRGALLKQARLRAAQELQADAEFYRERADAIEQRMREDKATVERAAARARAGLPR